MNTNTPTHRGFSLVELVACIAIVIVVAAASWPVIARARAGAMTDVSIANLESMAFAHFAYALDYDGRQFTAAIDDIASYGDDVSTAVSSYHAANGGCGAGSDPGCHPPFLLGWCDGGLWGYWMDWPGNYILIEPIRFGNGFGSFRVPNGKGFHDYVGGRFYSPTFFAPGDVKPYEAVTPLFDNPCEFFLVQGGAMLYWSSYAFSPAAMFTPDVMRAPSEGGWQDPWSLDDGLTCPPVAAAVYPNLKTRMLEHHWVGAAEDCNPAFVGGTYDGCEPYYFNHGIDAAPVAMFFDGHVRQLPNGEVQAGDQFVLSQTGGVDGLWSRDTPFGNDGYFLDLSYDGIVDVSHHVLTTGGIEGRDTLGALAFGSDRVRPSLDRADRKRAKTRRFVSPPLIAEAFVP